MTDIPNNPNYRLFYQLDELLVVNVTVRLGPTKGLKACFVRVEHGTTGPFVPMMLSMQ